MKKLTAWGFVLLAMIHLCVLQLLPGSDLREVCALTEKNKPRRGEWGTTNQIDWVAGRTAPDNVLMRMTAAAKTNLALTSEAAFCYFRATYVLYPRRLYLAPADQVINEGREIQGTSFDPDTQWLREKDVRHVLIFGSETNIGAKPLLESLEDWEGNLATAAKKSGAD